MYLVSLSEEQRAVVIEILDMATIQGKAAGEFIKLRNAFVDAKPEKRVEENSTKEE